MPGYKLWQNRLYNRERLCVSTKIINAWIIIKQQNNSFLCHMQAEIWYIYIYIYSNVLWSDIKSKCQVSYAGNLFAADYDKWLQFFQCGLVLYQIWLVLWILSITLWSSGKDKNIETSKGCEPHNRRKGFVFVKF